jgi:ABC-type transport system involved in cytochrome c biogenesis permease subunit
MFQFICFGGGLLCVVTPIVLFPLRRRVRPALRRRSGVTNAELSCFLLAFGALCLGNAYADGIPYGHFREIVGRWVIAACVAMFIWMVTLANVAGRRLERQRVQATAARDVSGDAFLILPGAKDQGTDAAYNATKHDAGPVAGAL